MTPRLVGSVVAAAPDAEASDLLVLLPSLGTTVALWDDVVALLRLQRPSTRILRVDLPGHGASPATTVPFTIAEAAEAVLSVVDEIGGGRFAIAGVSLGGVVALEVALAHPDRVSGLAMLCSGASIATPAVWEERAAQVRASGTASLVGGSATRWFAPGYLDRAPQGPGAATLERLMHVDDESYALCTEALAASDRNADLAALRMPTLVIAGSEDQVTTPESMAVLASKVEGAVYAVIPDASHLAVLERPDEIVPLMADWLGGPTTLDQVRARGMVTRRVVLGSEHVDRATAAATPETQPFQEFITRYAWGDVWSRPGIPRRDRSIATLAVLVADGHEHELRMHISAAFRNGLTKAEIVEVLLTVALYAGLPPVNRAFAILAEVVAESEAQTEAGTTEENDG